jgi:hypothetical protein
VVIEWGVLIQLGRTNVLIVGLLGSLKDLFYPQAKFLKCTKLNFFFENITRSKLFFADIYTCRQSRCSKICFVAAVLGGLFEKVVFAGRPCRQQFLRQAPFLKLMINPFH